MEFENGFRMIKKTEEAEREANFRGVKAVFKLETHLKNTEMFLNLISWNRISKFVHKEKKTEATEPNLHPNEEATVPNN